MKHIQLLNEDVEFLHTYTALPCCNTCDSDCTTNCGCDTYVCGAGNVTCGSCNIACQGCNVNTCYTYN